MYFFLSDAVDVQNGAALSNPVYVYKKQAFKTLVKMVIIKDGKLLTFWDKFSN